MTVSISVTVRLAQFRVKLSQDVPAKLGAKIGRTAHIRDRADLAARDLAGFADRLYRERFSRKECLGLTKSNDVGPDAAVRNSHVADRFSAASHPDGGGEGADVQILSLRDLVQLEDVAAGRQWDVNRRDYLVGRGHRLLVSRVEVVDV